MARIHALAALPFLFALLAGCAAPPADDEPEPPTAESYTLTAEGVEDIVTAGSNVTFNLTIEGEPEWTSDHIGGHFGMNSTDQPSTTAYTKACVHQAGDVPGEYEVTCAMDEAGDWYLRGHTRITLDGGEQLNYWTEEFTIVVLP